MAKSNNARATGPRSADERAAAAHPRGHHGLRGEQDRRHLPLPHLRALLRPQVEGDEAHHQRQGGRAEADSVRIRISEFCSEKV